MAVGRVRWRITVRGDSTELRGYLEVNDSPGAPDDLEYFAAVMKPFGIVMASIADDDYNPFKEWTE